MNKDEHKQASMNIVSNTLILIKYFICRNFEVLKYYIKIENTNELSNTNEHITERSRT
ncbi:hypothetical protein Hanom_Chr09g00777741 [Helianthus anomalus]